MRKAGLEVRLIQGIEKSDIGLRPDLANIPVLTALDFDHDFVSRFDPDEIMDDRLCLLHHSESVDWNDCWTEKYSTPLWQFNLQYFEYLLSLVKKYRDSGEVRYVDKGKSIISSWIDSCPECKGGASWHPYTVSMRVVNWLAFCGEAEEALLFDQPFVEMLNGSLREQYWFLLNHLERDLLANHYLENLKALVMLSSYFGDADVLRVVYEELIAQVREQILPDGMHYELSPMYHRIMLEALIRAATCVQRVLPEENAAEAFRLQDMCDCMYSMERNTCRIPLFNDSGNNVAKSKEALLECAKSHFGIFPSYKSQLEQAGYCFLERDTSQGLVKVVFDAGLPGPNYAMGHAHCDALSFECFVNGVPVLVNGGTYAYQSEMRGWFRSGEAHSAVWSASCDQSECWKEHRVARASATRLIASGGGCDSPSVTAEMTDYRGNIIRRTVCLGAEALEITDWTSSKHGFNSMLRWPSRTGKAYAPEFGKLEHASSFCVTSHCGETRFEIPWESICLGAPVVNCCHER